MPSTRISIVRHSSPSSHGDLELALDGPQGGRCARDRLGPGSAVSAQSIMTGGGLHQFASILYPICRSITGQGVRETLALIGGRIPLAIHEVPSGTSVYDWEVPLEWNIEDAAVLAPDGERIVDFRKHNLHVVSYAEPV